MPGFLAVFGYPDPTSPTGYGISSTVQQLITSLMTLGGFLGNLMVGPISRYLGRRHCLIAACSGCILALGLQFSTNIGAVYFARLLIGYSLFTILLMSGISIAFLGSFSQIYVIESMPPQIRGSLISAYSVFISIGGIVAR
jgi:MFS family permease